MSASDSGAERMPAGVFVTAHDQFAMRAFDAHAIDYLVKPLDVERFETALSRVRERFRLMHSANLAAKLNTLERQLDSSRFGRVHPAAIVQLNRVRELRTTESGDEALLQDGSRIPVSRERAILDQLLRQRCCVRWP